MSNDIREYLKTVRSLPSRPIMFLISIILLNGNAVADSAYDADEARQKIANWPDAFKSAEIYDPSMRIVESFQEHESINTDT